MWQLYSGNDRQKFFSAAQREWLEKYKGHDEAITSLLERVKGTRSSLGEGKLMPSFFAVRSAGRSSAAAGSSVHLTTAVFARIDAYYVFSACDTVIGNHNLLFTDWVGGWVGSNKY